MPLPKTNAPGPNEGVHKKEWDYRDQEAWVRRRPGKHDRGICQAVDLDDPSLRRRTNPIDARAMAIAPTITKTTPIEGGSFALGRLSMASPASLALLTSVVIALSSTPVADDVR